MARPVIDYTDEEIEAEIRHQSQGVSFNSVNDLLRERDRRTADRRAAESARVVRLATAAAVVSAVSAFVALIVGVVAR